MKTTSTKKTKDVKEKKEKPPIITQQDVKSAIENNPDMRWFILMTYSGKDMAAMESVKERLKTSETEDNVGIIVLAERNITVTQGDKLRVKRQNLYPSYLWILSKVNETGYMDEKTFLAINGAANITHKFAGQKDGFLPKSVISKQEVLRMVSQLQESEDDVENEFSLSLDASVRVTKGTFASLTGVVKEINDKKSMAIVALPLFGKESNVEIPFTDLELIK